MDVTSTALVIAGLKYVGQPAAQVVGRLVERVLGPVMDTAGEALDAWVRGRHQRGVGILMDSARMLGDAQLEPQPVPGRILFPLMQHASLEEDDGFQAKWAALLANAASPGFENMVLPAYAEILRQLVPAQVRILDHMDQQRYRLGDTDVWMRVEREDVMSLFGLDRAEYTLLVCDLDRLQLIDARRLSFEELGQNREDLYGCIRPTALCLGFFRAVTPPAKKG